MRGNSPLTALERKAAAIIASKDQYPFFSLATALSIASRIYEAGARLRGALYDNGLLLRRTLPCPVISIGNLSVGGSGKTPLTVHLAKLLQDSGLRVMVVSRGYRGEGERRGAVVSDGRNILREGLQAGDEPFLMAALLDSVPVVVGRDRWAVGRDGINRFKPEAILLDDAFQHRRLARDVNLVLMDFQAPLGNGHLLPRGPLREPPSALSRADAIIFTRCEGEQSHQYLEVVRNIHPRPFFHARHLPVVRCVVPAGELITSKKVGSASGDSLERLQAESCFAFAGLARNQEFFDTIGRMGGRLLDTRGFADHHPYQSSELAQMAAEAQRQGCRAMVTSDKDFVRLPALALPLDLIVLGVDIDFGADASRWRRFIHERMLQSEGPP